MNDQRNVADDVVITRLRRALDEVAAGADVDDDPVRTTSTHGVRPGRGRATTVLGVAAASAALIGGATWALSQRSPSPIDIAAPLPEATADAPATTVLGGGEPWFTLASANLVPGRISRPEQFPSDGEPLFQSWRVRGEGLDGFLFATIYGSRPIEQPEVAAGGTVEELADVPDGRAWLVVPPSTTGAFVAPSLWWARTDASLWVFDQQGLSTAVSPSIWVDLALGAQPGSGVPIVLPEAGTTVLSVGITATTIVTQAYTGIAAGRADLTVSDGASAPMALIGAVAVEPATVAGSAGWRGTYADGHVEVVWPAGGGWWGLLGISPELAEQADGIIAAAGPAGGVMIPAEPVQPPADVPEYEVSASVIETPDHGPMIAFVFRESLPPQGGDIPLIGFDWADIADERSMGGTTWTDANYELVGTWDGAAFTLTRPPAVRTTSTASGFTTNELTPGCSDGDVQPWLDVLSSIDAAALGIIMSNDDRWDGRCGVYVRARFDTPELAAALVPLGDRVTVEYAFTPVAP